MKLQPMKNSAITVLASGLLLAASLNVQAARQTQQVQEGPSDLANRFLECVDGTRFYPQPGVPLHPSLCDDHGGVKAGGGIGGGGGPLPTGQVRNITDNGDDGRVEAQDYNSTRSNRRKN